MRGARLGLGVDVRVGGRFVAVALGRAVSVNVVLGSGVLVRFKVGEGKLFSVASKLGG